MILKELNDLYLRLLDDPQQDVPRRHWSREKVAWEVTISPEGLVESILPLQGGTDEKLIPFKHMLVPEHVSRTVGILPFFLCDNLAYLLGYDEKRGQQKFERAAALHHEVLDGCEDPSAQAVLRFFDREGRDASLSEEEKAALTDEGGFAVFRVSDQGGYVHENAAVQRAWADYRGASRDGAVMGQCSVTGEHSELGRLFPQVTGVYGAQSAGASLVSFNKASFESYGKKQAYNASISEEASFNAGSALKHLFSDPRHHVRIGDTTVVFWADRLAPLETEMALSFFSGLPAAEDEETRDKVERALIDMKANRPVPECDYETRFFILGLAPNAARLSVRFFETSTFGQLAENHGTYLRDIEMVGVSATALGLLIRQTAAEGKADNLPSTLVNGCMAALLKGTRFPESLLYLLLMRMRADHGAKNAWDMGQRASLIKGCLARKQRLARRRKAQGNNQPATQERSLGMKLDRERTNRGYVLGRLFAVMERAQEEAIGEMNASIRERYMTGASTMPARVFPHLMQNYQNHIMKLKKKPGKEWLFPWLDRTSEEIMGLLDGEELFPKTLDMTEQGEFFVGYYQQRTDLWSKREDRAPEPGKRLTSTMED